MVVLQVTSDCSAPEWVMFELQGDVERRVGQISGEDFKDRHCHLLQHSEQDSSHLLFLKSRNAYGFTHFVRVRCRRGGRLLSWSLATTSLRAR